jgi:selenocysteine-specific elongation factor
MHVIGTAGHVDHGKSTLIQGLTGIHPDRLKEEQEREMTIDLGFGWLKLPNGEEVGIVDVPGHRDFIENMLAGVAGIDAVLLVIAADEGVMPQTREHLAILDLLQVNHGMIVLTKIDLAGDVEWLEYIEKDIRLVLQGTLLESAPIARVSNTTKAGYPQLLQELQNILQSTTERKDLGRARMPIDRVFSMPGFGTVITGTLADGTLEKGEEIEILPAGLHARIRGLQTHKQKEDTAVPGSRTAINLSGLEMVQVRRGDVAAKPGQYLATQRLDVRFRMLKDASAPLQHHSEVKLFLGTSETTADVRLLGTEVLNPGETGWLQLELHQAVVAARGDKYILRRPSPAETLGGGSIVDPHPKERHKRFDKDLNARLEALIKGSPAEVLIQAGLSAGFPFLIREMIAQSRVDLSEANPAVEELLSSGQWVCLEGNPWTMESIAAAEPVWVHLKDTILIALKAYHHDYPLKHGMPREELKSRLKMPPRAYNAVVRSLSREGMVAEGNKWIALPEHRVKFSPFQQTKVDRLMERFAAAPYSPPTMKECEAEAGEDVINTLIDFGDLVAVSGEVIFRKEDYDAMVEKFRQALQEKGKITLAETRDLFNTSRRYIQAFLEYLDAQEVTVREGDYRKLKYNH